MGFSAQSGGIPPDNISIQAINGLLSSIAGNGFYYLPHPNIFTIVQGTYTITFNGAYAFSQFVNCTSANNADEFTFPVFLTPGTWKIHYYGQKNNNLGIVKIYADSTLLATFDMYAGVGVDTLVSSGNITITAPKLYTMHHKIDGKNAASSGYGNRIFGIYFERVA